MDATWPDAPELERPRILRQRWLDLTFLHWALDPAEVARFFPPGTHPDTYEGRTYVGLVPFRMTGTGFPHGPAVPVLGSFLETNIRLYSVDESGRRGVVFLSLDADRLALVATARTIFGLPYRWAKLTHTQVADHHTYTSVLRRPGAHATSTITVQIGSPVPSDPLTDFLTARWGLHTYRARRTWYLPNHHPVWSFRTATLSTFEIGGLFASVGLAEPTRPPDHVLHSPGVPATFALPVRI